MTRKNNLITDAIGLVGITTLAKACDVTYQAVRRWEKDRRLPRKELTGETEYARLIARATRNQISRKDLIDFTRSGWKG